MSPKSSGSVVSPLATVELDAVLWILLDQFGTTPLGFATLMEGRRAARKSSDSVVSPLAMVDLDLALRMLLPDEFGKTIPFEAFVILGLRVVARSARSSGSVVSPLATVESDVDL